MSSEAVNFPATRKFLERFQAPGETVGFFFHGEKVPWKDLVKELNVLLAPFSSAPERRLREYKGGGWFHLPLERWRS